MQWKIVIVITWTEIDVGTLWINVLGGRLAGTRNPDAYDSWLKGRHRPEIVQALTQATDKLISNQ